MPTVYLHIGSAKTGTSSIQQFFLQNRKLFLKHFNLITPKTGRDHTEGSHHPLAFSFTENIQLSRYGGIKTPEQYAKEMQKELKNSQADVLLTSECFWFAREGLAQFLYEVFPNYDIEVVMYVRRIDHYVEAAWSQHVKGRVFVDSFDTFVKRFRYFNYQWPKYWQQVLDLEASSVIIAPYESSQFYGNALLSDFVHRLFNTDIPDTFKIPQENANPRLTRDALEYMLAVNRCQTARAKKEIFRKRLIDFSIETDPSTNSAFQSHGLLSHSQRLELLESAKEDDGRIAREYLGRQNGVVFTQPIPEESADALEYPGFTVDAAVNVSQHLIGGAFSNLNLDSSLSEREQISIVIEQTARAL